MLAKYHPIYNLLLILISIERFCFCESSDPVDNDQIHVKNDSKTPSELVEQIVKKVCNMTIETLATSPNVEKELLISKIENKLHQSANALNYKDRYVELIMKGVRLIAYNNTRKSDDTTNNNIESNKPSKTELINKIAQKVELIANAYSKKSNDRSEVIIDLQKVLNKAATKKHKELHAKHDQMKTYTNLISQGFAQVMAKIKEARRMELQFVKKKKLSNNDEHSNNKRKAYGQHKQALEQINPSTARPSGHVNDLREMKCHDIKNHICKDIKSLDVLQCPADNTEISVEKLCDGMMDCSDSSDERNCTGRVLEIVRIASGLMTEIELAIITECYPPSVENAVISKENNSLSEVLRTQVKFIHKHSTEVYSMRNFLNLEKARSAANEVVDVIHTLSLALQLALCTEYTVANKTRKPEIFDKKTRYNLRQINRANTDDKEISHGNDSKITYDIDISAENDVRPKPIFSSCVCNQQYCLHSKCREDCKDVCWQNYTLGRWQCEAVIGGKSVSLNEICDGKLDCFDESDENGCFEGSSFAKFEANHLYEIIIQTIILKIKAERVEPIRRLLIKLSNSVRSFQYLTAKNNPNNFETKRIRDQCFAEMVSIYGKHLEMSTSMVEMHKIYAFLLNLHDQLINAAKRSHTGNERIITADGCYCANQKCALPKCSNVCVKACSAESLLTRYYCGSSNNFVNSIPSTAVCNGKVNCANNDDEEDCKKEICRKHHLVLLRHNVQKIGDNRELKGTYVGDALNSWMLKVTPTLRIAESEARPTPKVMHNVVKSMLRDLLMSYAGMEEGKNHNNDLVLEQFYNVSQTVMGTLRSCGQ